MMPAGNGTTRRVGENSTSGRAKNPRPVPVPPWVRAGFRVASVMAPGAAAQLAKTLFFTPRHARVKDEERAVLVRGAPFSLGSGEKTIAGRIWGDRAPIVLLVHGWGGHAGQMTRLVDPLLAAGFRVVAIDLPAHGESEGRLSSVVHFADAIERAVSHFGGVHAIVAHSFGAAGTSLALSRGLSTKRAVFFAPPARFDSFWSRFRAGVGVNADVWERMVRDAESWLKVRFDGIAPIGLASMMSTPLLVLHADNDREIAFDEGRELAGRWPGAIFRPSAGLGHLGILRDEASVGAAVGFVSEADVAKMSVSRPAHAS
jgi:hypothetical protein